MENNLESSPAELERLDKEATAGPWAVDKTVALGAYGIWQDGTVLPESEPMKRICSMCPHDNPGVSQKQRDANAALIVYLRNHVDSIVAALRAAGEGEGKLGEIAKECLKCRTTHTIRSILAIVRR